MLCISCSAIGVTQQEHQPRPQQRSAESSHHFRPWSGFSSQTVSAAQFGARSKGRSDAMS